MKVTNISIALRSLAALSLFVCAAAPLQAHAGKDHIIWVGAEDREGWNSVSVITDGSGNMVALDVDGDRYSLASVRRGSVIQIDGLKSDRDVLKLSGASLDSSTGGSLTFSYLHNGMSDNWDHYQMDVRKVNGDWKVFPRGGSRPLASFYLTKKTFLGADIGVDKINPRLEASLNRAMMADASAQQPMATNDISITGNDINPIHESMGDDGRRSGPETSAAI